MVIVLIYILIVGMLFLLVTLWLANLKPYNYRETTNIDESNIYEAELSKKHIYNVLQFDDAICFLPDGAYFNEKNQTITMPNNKEYKVTTKINK